jgi:NADH-quinone oxidoreductase subunit A
MDQSYLSEWGKVLLFIIGGLLFVLITFFISSLLRPNKPNPEKLATYESGEAPQGTAWVQFNLRFYIIALIFILFEAEIIFLFPWATIFADKNLIEQTNEAWGWFSFVEMLIFIFVLAIGLAYAWVNGFLDWVKPELTTTDYKSPVPKNLYDKVNERYNSK